MIKKLTFNTGPKKLLTCKLPRRMQAKKAMYSLIWRKTKKEREVLLSNFINSAIN